MADATRDYGTSSGNADRPDLAQVASQYAMDLQNVAFGRPQFAGYVLSFPHPVSRKSGSISGAGAGYGILTSAQLATRSGIRDINDWDVPTGDNTNKDKWNFEVDQLGEAQGWSDHDPNVIDDRNAGGDPEEDATRLSLKRHLQFFDEKKFHALICGASDPGVGGNTEIDCGSVGRWSTLSTDVGSQLMTARESHASAVPEAAGALQTLYTGWRSLNDLLQNENMKDWGGVDHVGAADEKILLRWLATYGIENLVIGMDNGSLSDFAFLCAWYPGQKDMPQTFRRPYYTGIGTGTPDELGIRTVMISNATADRHKVYVNADVDCVYDSGLLVRFKDTRA